jgi:hypothetical protein
MAFVAMPFFIDCRLFLISNTNYHELNMNY